MQVMLVPAGSLHWDDGEDGTSVAPAGAGKHSFSAGGHDPGREGRAGELTGRLKTSRRSDRDSNRETAYTLPGPSAWLVLADDWLVLADELSAVGALSTSETMPSTGRSSGPRLFACSPRPSAFSVGQGRVHEFVWAHGAV